MNATNPTRRQFVKQSILTGITAALAAEIAGKGAIRAEAAAGGGAVGPAFPPHDPAKKTYPVTQYGSGEPIYLADFDRCQPSSALDRSWTPHQWRLIDFVSKHAKGTLIASNQITGVPDVTYSIRQRGWYAIYFGLLSLDTESRVQVRLKRDPVFSVLTPNDMTETQTDWVDLQFGNHKYRSDGIEDLFWKYAELSGDDAVVIRQLKVQFVPGDPDANGNSFTPSTLGYIKLVPLSESEVQALQADRSRRDTRRLFATDDANSVAGFFDMKTEDDIRRQLEPYRDTDFSRMYWEAGMGDLTYYPSKIGTLLTFEWRKGFSRRYERLIAEGYGGLQKRGVDPFRVALDYCREIGLEFHASYRVGGFHWPSPEDEWRVNGLYDRHPEWRCLDRQGRSTPRLSYAFPGVRKYVLSLFQEMVTNYPLDGVCVLYNRRMPILGYEAPLADGFRAKHGIDPRTLPESDPRWLAHSAEVLTGFMRDLRQLMREEEKRQSRRPIGITTLVLGSREENYGYGMDLEAWVKEGLIDTLVPYTSVAGGSSLPRSWEDTRAAEYFINLTKGTPCLLSLNLMPRNVPPEEYKRRAHALYQAGAESLFLWDTYQRANFDRSWSTVSRLGHREELADWHAQGSPKVAKPHSPLTQLGDWDMAYRTPG